MERYAYEMGLEEQEAERYAAEGLEGEDAEDEGEHY